MASTSNMTATMNPVEHALLLLGEYFQSTTDAARAVEILTEMQGIKLTASQKDEFNVRGNELVERYA